MAPLPSPPLRGVLAPYGPTWPGHQLPSPVPRPTHVPAAHTASDFGSTPGLTAAPRPVPSGGSPLPRGMDTQSSDPDHLQPQASPSFTPSTEPYLPKHLLLGTPPCAPCQVTVSVGRLEPGLAPSHGGIQQTAPGTKHHPASPQRRSVLRRGALQSFTRHPTPQHHGRRSVFPSPSSGSPSIDQRISSATRITHALRPYPQCPCSVSSSPTAVSALPAAHMSFPLAGPSSQQDPGVELLTLSWSLGLSLRGTHLLSISPLRCPSLFRNGPASFWSAWWESHHRPSFLSKTPLNWENMGSEYNYAIRWKCIMCFLLHKCFICSNSFHLYNNPT